MLMFMSAILVEVTFAKWVWSDGGTEAADVDDGNNEKTDKINQTNTYFQNGGIAVKRLGFTSNRALNVSYNDTQVQEISHFSSDKTTIEG